MYKFTFQLICPLMFIDLTNERNWIQWYSISLFRTKDITAHDIPHKKLLSY